MNPSESLSFTRLIKSLVPGVILIYHYIFLVEFGGLVVSGRHPRIVSALISRDIPATLFLTVLLPTALILGFLLNTAWWLWFGDFVKTRTRSKLHPKLQQMYSYVKHCAHRHLEETLPQDPPTSETGPNPASNDGPLKARSTLKDRLYAWVDRRRGQDTLSVDVEAFLLPALQREKYGLVKESYFAWYEFQANSCLAVLVAYFLFLLSIPWAGLENPTTLPLASGAPQSWTALGVWVAASGLCTLLFGLFLAKAAISNLRRHHHFLLWFLLGSIEVTSDQKLCMRRWEGAVTDLAKANPEEEG
jgi:hypothetical protein